MGERTWVSSFKEYPYYGRHIGFCFKKRHEKLIFVTLIAIFAEAVEIQTVTDYVSAYGFADPFVQVPMNWDVDILHLSAVDADKMVVGGCDSVKAIKGTTELEDLDKSLIVKNMQVPIHGTQA
jgi:hypothetical protein